MPLPAAEADDRAVREDGVVQDAGDPVGQEVARGEAAGATGQAVLGLRVVVPAGLRVGEARADPFADVVQADVGRGDPAVVRPVLGDAGLARAGRADEEDGEGGRRRVRCRGRGGRCRGGADRAAGRQRDVSGAVGGLRAGGVPRGRGRRHQAGGGRGLLRGRRHRSGRSREARRRGDGGGSLGDSRVRARVVCGRHPAGVRALPRLVGRRRRRPHCVLHPLPLRLVHTSGTGSGGVPRSLPRTVPSPAVVW
ncbi:hypothetical protein SCANM63S_00164 [Streptomyces canarius]